MSHMQGSGTKPTFISRGEGVDLDVQKQAHFQGIAIHKEEERL